MRKTLLQTANQKRHGMTNTPVTRIINDAIGVAVLRAKDANEAFCVYRMSKNYPQQFSVAPLHCVGVSREAERVCTVRHDGQRTLIHWND